MFAELDRQFDHGEDVWIGIKAEGGGFGDTPFDQADDFVFAEFPAKSRELFKTVIDKVVFSLELESAGENPEMFGAELEWQVSLPYDGPLAFDAGKEHVIVIFVFIGVWFAAEDGAPILLEAFDEAAVGGQAKVERVGVEGLHAGNFGDGAAEGVALFVGRVLNGAGGILEADVGGSEEGFGILSFERGPDSLKEIGDLDAGGVVEGYFGGGLERPRAGAGGF